MATLRRLVLTGILLALAACGPATRRDGVDAACSRISFEGAAFTACRARPGVHDLLVVDRGAAGRPMRDFDGLPARLGARFARLAFAMNAGMFDDKGLPVGYYVEDGAAQLPVAHRSDEGALVAKGAAGDVEQP